LEALLLDIENASIMSVNQHSNPQDGRQQDLIEFFNDIEENSIHQNPSTLFAPDLPTNKNKSKNIMEKRQQLETMMQEILQQEIMDDSSSRASQTTVPLIPLDFQLMMDGQGLTQPIIKYLKEPLQPTGFIGPNREEFNSYLTIPTVETKPLPTLHLILGILA
jgi:hypothetical protein